MFGDKKDEDRARKADERRQARGECIEVRRAEAKKSRRDLIRTCVGRSLVGQGATGIFHCQENLERARRENSPSTALIDSSVLAMAYTLSARISPKKPARIRVEMTRPVETEQFTIAPYTALSSDQFALFNRRAITCEAEEAEALAAYRLAVLRATEEVENSFSALVKREAQVGILTQGESSLARARENSLAAYKGGGVSLIEVLNADGNLLQMRDEKAQAQAEAACAAISSFRALGGGWDARNASSNRYGALQ